MSEIVRFNDKTEFFEAIKPLEHLFSALSDEQRDIYYEALRGKDRDTLRLAVRWLLNEYKYRKFPLIKDIRGAIEVVVSSQSRKESEDFRSMQKDTTCYSCHSTGYVLFEKNHEEMKGTYTTARYCGCPIGKHLQNTVDWSDKN